MMQPTITIDDLSRAPYTLEMKARQESPRSYQARAIQGDVQATITIRYYNDHQFPGGYILNEQIDRANPFAPGAMGRKQEQRAKTLLTVLREQVQAALTSAHWVKRWQTLSGADLWLYIGEQDQPRKQESVTTGQGKSSKVLSVPGRGDVAGYKRTITASNVTYTCARCQSEVTRALFPGAAPRYCELCAKEVEREKTRARVARLRAAKKNQLTNCNGN